MVEKFVMNEWDGWAQRMGINFGIVGWGVFSTITHQELNLWIQTAASTTALFIVIWNFWGSVKENNRKKAKEKEDNKYGNTL